MGHIAVTLVDDRVAWVRTRVRRGAGATLDDISSLALAFPHSLSSFSFPFLLAVSIAEFPFVITFRLSVVAQIRRGPHALVIVHLV